MNANTHLARRHPGFMGDGGANLWRGILDKIVIRSCAVRHYIVLHAWLICSRRYYIAPDMLSFRNGDAIISYHMMLDRDR